MKRRAGTLANGLEWLLLPGASTPIVTCALFYKIGTRDECADEAGMAHFLEHMMFKGSAGYGEGEVDRVTEAHGGHNNAFTSHDATVYYFQFASDLWPIALEIERDRMQFLALETEAVRSECAVIGEEILMYDAEPWDALDVAATKALFQEHAYGAPVLGTQDSIRSFTARSLRAFYERHYHPANAVLVLAGDLGDEARALGRVEETLGQVPRPSGAGHGARAAVAERVLEGGGCVELELERGSTPRLQMGWLAPSSQEPDWTALRLALTILATGRSSRLYQRLVERDRSCAWISADIREHVGPGACWLNAELLSGASRDVVLSAVGEEVERFLERAPDSASLERARRMLLADWTFAQERVHRRALVAGFAMALFDEGYPARHVRRLETLSAEAVLAAARSYLKRSDRVIAWALPEVMDNKP